MLHLNFLKFAASGGISPSRAPTTMPTDQSQARSLLSNVYVHLASHMLLLERHCMCTLLEGLRMQQLDAMFYTLLRIY